MPHVSFSVSVSSFCFQLSSVRRSVDALCWKIGAAAAACTTLAPVFQARPAANYAPIERQRTPFSAIIFWKAAKKVHSSLGFSYGAGSTIQFSDFSVIPQFICKQLMHSLTRYDGLLTRARFCKHQENSGKYSLAQLWQTSCMSTTSSLAFSLSLSVYSPSQP